MGYPAKMPTTTDRPRTNPVSSVVDNFMEIVDDPNIDLYVALNYLIDDYIYEPRGT